MRVLFVTAYFPPCPHGWGYMRVCEQVADGLHELGDDVAILTSNYQTGEEVKSYPVFRDLRISPDWICRRPIVWQFYVDRRRSEARGVRALTLLHQRWRPDIIFIWDAYGLPRQLLRFAEGLDHTRVVYYFANYLPELADEFISYWTNGTKRPISRVAKSLIGPFALKTMKREGKPVLLDFKHSICVSHYVLDRLKKKRLIGEHTTVIPNGVDLNKFRTHTTPLPRLDNIKCLYAGRVAPEKGVHTLLNGFVLLRNSNLLDRIRLTIIGDGPREYLASLRRMITAHGLESVVRFRTPVSIDTMPSVFSEHDVLILPSEWEEPLACVMLEAMAAGLLVIGTTTGGTGEVLSHESTGLVFRAGDASSLVVQLQRMFEEPELCDRLAHSARRKVEAEYDIRGITRQIRRRLSEWVHE